MSIVFAAVPAFDAELHFNRLHRPPYDMDHVFDGNPGWPGDREGRAMLAFLCHYAMSGRKIPALDGMMRDLPERTNRRLFFGETPGGAWADEQQLSGHNWYLRALVMHHAIFGDAFSLRAAKSCFQHLFLSSLPLYDRYPLEREQCGGVDGHILKELNGWRLSSDVGCAFMCADGVARYYALTKDADAKPFLETLFRQFLDADMVASGFQTHTSLTCLRGMLCFYETTGEGRYLAAVIREFDRYIQHGMTLTYENFNWFGREDTWTEPCAVVDSLLLAVGLYHITGNTRYRTLARRVWANGLQFCLRDNGGAGTNACVTPLRPILKLSGYEASQCCTMRYAEALLCVHQNPELFVFDPAAPETVEPDGRRYRDDVLLVEVNGEKKPICSCRPIKKDAAERLRLKVLF